MENKEKILFTSESVTEGHPDKICDAISDAILDALIAQDPMSRVACETATTTGLVLVMGEITSKANIDIQSIVRETIREIGYTRGKFGFDADTCAVITALDKQSADIAMGVDKALEQKENQMDEDELDSIGAGDQGIQFGYASNETEEYMPYAINMAHKLSRQLTKVRKDGTLKYLRPDGKTQVTVDLLILSTCAPMPAIASSKTLMSLTSGRFSMRIVSSVIMAADKIASAAFFAPAISTSPTSGFPPLITYCSIIHLYYSYSASQKGYCQFLSNNLTALL